MLSENFCYAPSLIDNPLVTLFCTSLTKRRTKIKDNKKRSNPTKNAMIDKDETAS